MTASGWLELVLFVTLLTALTPMLGAYLHRVFSRPPHAVEGRLLALVGQDGGEQDWKAYGRR